MALPSKRVGPGKWLAKTTVRPASSTPFELPSFTRKKRTPAHHPWSMTMSSFTPYQQAIVGRSVPSAEELQEQPLAKCAEKTRLVGSRCWHSIRMGGIVFRIERDVKGNFGEQTSAVRYRSPPQVST